MIVTISWQGNSIGNSQQHFESLENGTINIIIIIIKKVQKVLPVVITSCSFSLQEAHAMVREANIARAAAEKKLNEAAGKVTSTTIRLLPDTFFPKFLYFSE